MKKMGGMGRKPRGGRPFGENSNSGKNGFTAYTRPSGGTKASMKIKGRKARGIANVNNFKGRASKNWTGALDGIKRGL